MRLPVFLIIFISLAGTALGQIQVELKFARLQYVAYEPVIATLQITNLAGRAIDLSDADGRRWFGFEVTGSDGQVVAPTPLGTELPLRMDAGQTVTRKINLTPRFAVNELGTYRVRANVFFADLNKFFYSQTKVFRVNDARAIWQRTVGVPESGETRTYSLLSNRFPDHTKLYVRVEDKSTGAVYTTLPLGRLVAIDEPQAQLDRANRLHVLHCAAPRTWAYSRIGLNGELLARSTFMETKSRPRLQAAPDGAIAVRGGLLERPAGSDVKASGPKLSTRPATPPTED
ncbi:MAG: hypothetical protein ABIR71_04675 [Chthoniobacterales bacterium]